MDDLILKFMKNVSKPNGEDGCWLWMRRRDKNGYGTCRILGLRQSHRASYALFKGPIPKGIFVLHTCDNPPCVNPKHLWLGTNQDNMDDMVRKKRSPFGEKSAHAKLTDDLVKAIRAEYIPRKGGNEKGIGGPGPRPRYIGSQRYLAKKYGVSRATIKFIVQNKSWKHIL